MSGKFSTKTSVGVDGQTKNDFVGNLSQELKFISASARNGSYQYNKLRPIALTKSNGKMRLINVPTIRDRFVQRVLLKFFRENYSDKWKLPHSFSSMGGDNEGVHKTLKAVQAKLRVQDYVIRADLSQFFDTIDRILLKEFIKRRVAHRSLHSLIHDAIDCETDVSSNYDQINFAESKLTKGLGIRQGMPISPVLAFLYLSKVDLKFATNYFRYVDDMLFYSDDVIVLRNKFQAYIKAVEKLGLKVHPLSDQREAKTKLYGPGDNVEFLGLTLIRSVEGNYFEIPSRVKDGVIKKSLDFSRFPHDNKRMQKGWLLAASHKASGLISDYKTAYGICRNWDDFAIELKQIQLGMCRNISKDAALLSKKGSKENTEKLLRAFSVFD